MERKIEKLQFILKKAENKVDSAIYQELQEFLGESKSNSQK